MFLAFCFWLFVSVGGASLFHPLPGATHFLCLAKESKQRKARPRWRLPLGFVSRGGKGGKLAALRQASLLDPPRNKNPRRHLGQERQRPHRRCAGLGGTGLLLLLLATLRGVLLAPAAMVIDGLAFPCPMRRLEFLLQGGKRGEACLSAASLPPLPPCDINSRRGSPHRARLSLLTFFGKTKKVSQPRQGMKQGMHHQQKKTARGKEALFEHRNPDTPPATPKPSSPTVQDPNSTPKPSSPTV